MAYRANPVTNSLWIIIGINVLLYIASIAVPDLLSFFGLQPVAFTQMPWTIITSIFMHGGFWHLFVNMITLYFFGTAIISLVGEGRFLLVYFLGGRAGNALFMLLGSPYSIVIGASGAVYALGGALAVMRPRVKVFVFPIPVPVPLWAAIVGGFIILSFAPSIAWQAHLGGLIVGVIAGYFFRRWEKRRYRWH